MSPSPEPAGRFASAVAPSSEPAGEAADELGARGDAELEKDVAQVVVDGPRAEEELGRYLLVRRPLRHEAHDLALLGGEPVRRAGIALARGLAARAQLDARALGPRGSAQPLERVQSRAQVQPRILATRVAAQELAEDELGARPVERTRSLAVQTQRFHEMPFGR